jgi:cob(I)alamin adenosyltransferase
MSDNQTTDERHAGKMKKRKEARDKIMAGKTEERGLIIVHTGKGKGKSTAAMGLALRTIGHGLKVGIVQFVKGAWETGERNVLDKFPDQVTIKAMGEGFTWDTQDRQRDVAAAMKAWATVQDMMADDSYHMVIADELNIVLRYDYLDAEVVIKALQAKRPDLHVVVTGRNAKAELIEIADLVTEMTQIKHPFRDGVKAQIGVEF